MKTASDRLLWLATFTTLVLLLGACSVSAFGQDAPSISVGNVQIKGLPEDWSHHHLVFSNAGTEEDAIRNNHYDEWLKIVSEPRYILQQLKRKAIAQGPSAEDVKWIQDLSAAARGETTQSTVVTTPRAGLKPGAVARPARPKLTKDWSMSLGVSGGLNPGQYPAKYSFYTTTASCSDYVVYPTGLGSSSTQATIVAYNNLYGGGNCTSAAGPPIYWAYNTSIGSSAATADLSPVLSPDGSQVAFVQSNASNQASLVILKMGPNATGRTVTGSLSTSSPQVTITSGTLSSTDVGAQISGTNIPAGDTIASVLSSTTANLATAPTAAHASETLTISAETVALPAVPPLATSAALYHTCTAPCMYAMTFSGTTTPNDTNSAPFYDYATDVLYVGDNSGSLHKFTNVFGGSPAEITGGGASTGWPQLMASGAGTLTSPVLDPVSGNVFVGGSGGYLYRIPGGGGGTGGGSSNIVASAHLSATGSTGVVDAPLVDLVPATPLVYVFVGDTTSFATAVEQFTNTFGAGTSATESATVSTSNPSTSTILYAGSFDNLHYDIGGSGGNMYVCGVHHTGLDPALFQVAMNTTFGSSVTEAEAIVADTSGFVPCSPVTEFLGSKANTTLSAAISSVPSDTTLAAAINHTTNPTATSLNGTITAAATSVAVSSATNIAAGDYISVGTEYMYVSAKSNNTLTVTRGANGSTPATHTTGSAVTIYSTLITVPTGTSVTTGEFVQIGTEILNITATNVTTGVGLTLTVTRGADGTTAATHTSGTTVSALTQVSVASATGIVANDYIQVDSDIMLVDYVSGTTLTVNQGALGTAAATHVNGDAVQDVQDWIYLSVTADGGDAACTSTTGCLYNYAVTTGTAPSVATAGIAANGGTGGVIIDNSSTAAGASQIYYSIQGNQACVGNGTTGAGTAGCAVQTLQSAP